MLSLAEADNTSGVKRKYWRAEVNIIFSLAFLPSLQLETPSDPCFLLSVQRSKEGVPQSSAKSNAPTAWVDALAGLRRCSQVTFLHKVSLMSQVQLLFCLLLEAIALLNYALPGARSAVLKMVRGVAHLLMSFSYGLWADIKNLLHFACQRGSLQMLKSAVRRRKKKNSRDAALQDEPSTSVFEITRRDTLLTENQLQVWKISQNHILTQLLPLAEFRVAEIQSWESMKLLYCLTWWCKTEQGQVTLCHGLVTGTRRPGVLVMCPWSPTNTCCFYCDSKQ